MHRALRVDEDGPVDAQIAQLRAELSMLVARLELRMTKLMFQRRSPCAVRRGKRRTGVRRLANVSQTVEETTAQHAGTVHRSMQRSSAESMPGLGATPPQPIPTASWIEYRERRLPRDRQEVPVAGHQDIGAAG